MLSRIYTRFTLFHKRASFSSPEFRTMASSTNHLSGPTEVKIQVPWGEIRGSRWGDPNGIRVLAIHGWLDNAGSFSKLLPLLSDGLDIVAIDLPGHGQSSHRGPGCRYNFIDYLADIKRAVDGLRWTEFILLGHSMGASVCTWFTAAMPNMVKAFVAIEGFGPLSRPLESIPELMAKALSEIGADPVDKKVYPTWKAAVERLKEGHMFDTDLTDEAAEALCQRGTKKVEGGYQFTRDLRLKQRSILYATEDLNATMIKRISCPTLVIIAEKTFIQADTINSRIKFMKDKQELVKLVAVPGGHHVHLYEPQTIAPLIDSFLHSQTVPADYKVLSQL